MTEVVHDLNQGWNQLAAEMLYPDLSGAGEKGAVSEKLTFLERRIRANGGTALDQGCGSGRYLFGLLERGLEVHGADISGDVVQFARKEAEARNVHTMLYHQGMGECNIPHQYGTIYITDGIFAYITDRHQALSTLARFQHHLVPGGQVLIELDLPPDDDETTDKSERYGPSPRPGAEGEIFLTLWGASVDRFEQIWQNKRRYELYLDGELMRSEVHSCRGRWYSHYEFIMMLERTGFEDIRTYADYTDQPATQDSRSIVYGARRPST